MKQVTSAAGATQPVLPRRYNGIRASMPAQLVCDTWDVSSDRALQAVWLLAGCLKCVQAAPHAGISQAEYLLLNSSSYCLQIKR